MEARKLSQGEGSAFEISLRVRHPTIDPDEISNTLQFEPEHCFKAGEARSTMGGATHLTHAQTYWLAPISIESRATSEAVVRLGAADERIASMQQKYEHLSLEGQLFALLVRLNGHQEFVQRLRKDGGDISILVAISRDEVRSFTVSEPMARFLAKLGIDVDFEFATDD
jgi:hypothetical protein